MQTKHVFFKRTGNRNAAATGDINKQISGGVTFVLFSVGGVCMCTEIEEMTGCANVVSETSTEAVVEGDGRYDSSVG